MLVDVIQGAEANAKLGALLDTAFPVSAGGHFFDDFPVWDERKDPGPGEILRVGIFEGRELVTSACVRLAGLRAAAGRTVPVCLIGAVATASSHRGQGLASQAVQFAVQWAEERGAVLSLLWGSEHSLYRKLGFEPCGEQILLPLSTFNTEGFGADVSEGWQPGIFETLKLRDSGLVLEHKDYRWYSAHKNVRWFWVGEAKRPRAYAALGRGVDLHDVVHEWGGERDALFALFGHIQRVAPTAQLLGGPTVLKQYGFVFPEAQVAPLCLARITEPVVVFSAFAPGQQLDAVALKDLKPNEWSRLFFGPFEEGARIPPPFPLPLWIWGLDAA